MSSSNSFTNSWIWVAVLLLMLSITACNTVDTDFERNNPNDLIRPKIEILSPDNQFINHHADTLFVEIQVQDVNGPLEQVEVNFSSNRDGFLKTVRPNASGYAQAGLTGLSINSHYIQAEAVNTLGNTRADSVLVDNNGAPPVNILSAAFVDGFYNEISWERSPDDDFQHYDLYRINSLGNATNFARITDRDVTTYRDPAPIDSLTTYFVKTASAFYPNELSGRSKDIRRPSFFGRQESSVSFRATQFPNKPILIVSKRTSGTDELIAYNYATNELVAAEMSGGAMVQNIATGKFSSNPELYITTSQIPGRLYVYDPLTMELIEFINSTYPITNLQTDNRGNIIRLSNNLIQVSARDQFPAFGTQVTVSPVPGTLHVPEESNEIYYIPSGNVSNIRHMNYDNSGNIFGLTGPYIRVGFSSDLTIIHPKGDYFVTSGQAKIIDKVPSLEPISTLNVNASYIDYAFGRDGDVLFALDEGGWVDVYENLSLIDQIEIDMIPKNIFYDNGSIILFGKSKHLPVGQTDYYGVAVIPANY